MTLCQAVGRVAPVEDSLHSGCPCALLAHAPVPDVAVARSTGMLSCRYAVFAITKGRGVELACCRGWCHRSAASIHPLPREHITRLCLIRTSSLASAGASNETLLARQQGMCVFRRNGSYVDSCFSAYENVESCYRWKSCRANPSCCCGHVNWDDLGMLSSR